jgi:hypothetical protein
MGDADVALARPTAPELLCQTYPDLPRCAGAVVNCSVCHTSTDPPAWNAFGQALGRKIERGYPFEQELPKALHALEADDSDGDGLANLKELELGTKPGISDAEEVAAPSEPAGPNAYYRIGQYDHAFAFRRASILYCGKSPTFDEMEAFRAKPNDDATLKERLHSALTRCLESDYWNKQALPRLADKRIRPLRQAGPTSTVMIAGFRLVVGDYNYDYRLWRWALTKDRDMRELLTADYYVLEDGGGELVKAVEVIDKPDPGALAGGQPLAPELRVGMISTQWFLTINTMFSGLPRTTAAQVYRSYLGADLSNSDGIRPVAGEPIDVDEKGVKADRCAQCHSTLDPLAYAFAKYEGIQFSAELKFGYYRPERPLEMMPNWDDAKEQSVIFDQRVGDLVAWARVAAESDEFKRNMTDMFFRQAVNRAPGPLDQTEFVALLKTLPGDGYSANKLIHRLVDTKSFGSP